MLPLRYQRVYIKNRVSLLAKGSGKFRVLHRDQLRTRSRKCECRTDEWLRATPILAEETCFQNIDGTDLFSARQTGWNIVNWPETVHPKTHIPSIMTSALSRHTSPPTCLEVFFLQPGIFFSDQGSCSNRSMEPPRFHQPSIRSQPASGL